MLISDWTEKNPLCLVSNHALHVFSNTKPTQKVACLSQLSCLFTDELPEKKRFRLCRLNAQTLVISKPLLHAPHVQLAVRSAYLSGPLRPKKCIIFGYGKKRFESMRGLASSLVHIKYLFILFTSGNFKLRDNIWISL